MLPIIAGSLLLDPLVLMLFIYGIARSQMDTTYSTLFAINMILGVIALIGAIFLFPFDDTQFVRAAVVAFFFISTITITKCCCLSVPRGFVVSALFLAYKVAFIVGLVEILSIFGYNLDFSDVQLESLNSSNAPRFVQWVFEHGLWFKHD